METFVSLLARTAEALRQSNIPYMVIGGQAVLLHGEPRLTRDIDITLGIDIDSRDQIFGLAERVGLRPIPPDSSEFIQKTSVLPTVHDESGIRVDFIFSFTTYEQQAIDRAVRVSLENIDVRFATAEDTIIHKMFAGRPRDLEDVRGIVIRADGLDRAYVSKWLAEFSKSVERNLDKEFEEIVAKTN